MLQHFLHFKIQNQEILNPKFKIRYFIVSFKSLNSPNKTQMHSDGTVYIKQLTLCAMFVCKCLNSSIVVSGVSGEPRGNIVAFSENYDKDVVTNVKKSLASVGITITKTYTDTFPSLT